jgi:hypothetical protein
MRWNKSSRTWSLPTLAVVYLLVTSVLLPFAGSYGMIWRVVSLQVCVPLLTICFLIYIWNFGLSDKTSVRAKGRHFSSLKPRTQFVLRTILKSTGGLVIGVFLLGFILPLEIKAMKLVFFGDSEWIAANITSDDSPTRGRFLLQRVDVRTSDGQDRKLEYYLPGSSLRVGAWYTLQLLPGTSVVVNTR